jgi:hypothetical protein
MRPEGVPIRADIANRHDACNGTGFMGGLAARSYLPLVPLEMAGASTAFRGAASKSSKVACVSCHRAHASSGPRSGRWDFDIATWVDEGVGSGSYPIPNPYESTAGACRGGFARNATARALPGSPPNAEVAGNAIALGGSPRSATA